MFRIIFIFLLLINLCFSEEIKLKSYTNSPIIGKIKTTKKRNEIKIYVEGIEKIVQKVWNDNSEEEYYDYYEEEISILVDNISKNYSIIDIFTINLNFDDNEEICLVLKKDGKNYIKIYYYSSEDDKFYDFLNEEQNQEIKRLFSTDKNFSIDKLKKYLNDKLPFVELDTREFLYNIKKEFDKNLLSENLKFLRVNLGNELVYTDNSKNYYVFYYSGTRNIYSLFSYCEGELGKNYYPITGIAYYKNYGNSGDGAIRKVEYKDKKILKESIIQSFEPKISQDIFYDLNTSRVQKEYIYRNGILSKKILYTYLSNGKQEKVVENYDDFKQIQNWQKDKNGKLKERYKTEFQELDVSKGQLLYESLRTRLYTLYNNKTEKWCYVLMKRHPKECDYFYVKEIFYGTVSDLNLKNGISDIPKDGYTEIYATNYPVFLDSSTQIIEKGYYRKNKKDGMWIFNYAGQIYSKVYYIKGIPICYWDYDADDRLTEFGIYINSKRVKLKSNRYFYGISE
ncbi:hypothetical protein FV113G1_11340 [Fusobacterium varium]|nr:hypothetical protein FV113G1_11340 [Fusobacterium varium]